MNNYSTVFTETANTSTWNVFACSAPHQDASGNILLEQGLSAEESHFQFLQFTIELEQWFTGDKMFLQLFCSLLFSSQGSLTQRFSPSSHKPKSPTCFALLEEARRHSVASPRRTTLTKESWYSPGRKAASPADLVPAKRDGERRGKAMQTQPRPERFVLQLQRNCSPEVPCQGFSDFFLSHILRSTLWGASKAQTSDSVI